VSVPLTLLGLLERGPSHGYDLKRDYDAYFGRGQAAALQPGVRAPVPASPGREGGPRAGRAGAGRELTELKRDSDQVGVLLADHAIYRLEADLRWIDHTAARLD
jgi:hypothetical protein